MCVPILLQSYLHTYFKVTLIYNSMYILLTYWEYFRSIPFLTERVVDTKSIKSFGPF